MFFFILALVLMLATCPFSDGEIYSALMLASIAKTKLYLHFQLFVAIADFDLVTHGVFRLQLNRISRVLM